MMSASIIPYPVQTALGNKLRPRDKVDVCAWETSLGDVPQISRIVIHSSAPSDLDQFDFVLVYGPDSQWARWGLARRGAVVTLWQCSSGRELGVFASMEMALDAVHDHALRPPAQQQPARKRRAPPMTGAHAGVCDPR